MSTISRTVIGTGSAVLLAIALSGCSSLLPGGNDAQRDEEGAVTEDAKIDVFKLKVGDCIPMSEADASDSEEFSDIDVVPCDKEHALEVFYEYKLPDGDFPGMEAIDADAAEKCEPEFTSFVGLEPEADSTLGFTYYSPTQDGWEQLNDRVIQCVLGSLDGSSLTGSMKGKGI
ncbi:MAG: septum formation family protein [Microbacterium sp.]